MAFITYSIPCYNEGENIKHLCDDCIKVSEDLNLSDFEIYIIDDGSTDQTKTYIHQLIAKYPFIKLHEHKENLGFGPTIKEVFQHPKSKWIFFLSGDNQFPAKNLKRLIQYIDQYHFILGYRTERNDNLYRRFNSMIYNLYISILARKKVKDVNSIALVKSSAINQISLKSKSAFIHAEVYLKSTKNNISIIEVPILHNKRAYGEASGGKFKTIVFTIFESFKYIIGKL